MTSDHARRLNAATDVILRGADLLTALPRDGYSNQAMDLPVLQGVADLRACYAHFFARGAAAERFMANQTAFLDVADTANAVQHATFRTGGNAALMAEYLAELGSGIEVH